MSRSIALVKFPNEKVYLTCYNGTCDFIMPFLITEKRLESEYDNSVFAFYDSYYNNYSDPKWEILNCDLHSEEVEVEVYSDYGKGFYWKARGNEKLLILTNNTLWDEFYDVIEDGIPDWAYAFMKERGWII